MKNKYLWILLILPILACGVMGTPLPPAPTTVPGSTTSTPLPTDPSSPVLTTIPETELPPSATTFPDPNNYTWQVVAFGLERPVDLQADGSGRLFVIEKAGRIRIIENGQLIDTPFLNIEDRVNNNSNERGLLGLAFHPDYAQKGYFFVNYTGAGGDTFISRFQVTDDPSIADPSSEVNLLHINQPFPNHNGGGLDFGSDGYLYAGLGDGGAAGDPLGNGQKLDTLLGKVLRLDVDSAEPYSIPSDNPFGNEIWAYGLRNPWRIAFDPQTGDLYIGDVGQDVYEEIDHLPVGSTGGTDFGWDYYEGNHEYDLPSNVSGDFVFPVAEYSHAEGGCSVTGGYVYRGSLPEWDGIYLYGDYCTGYVWGLLNVNGEWQSKLMFDTDVNITSFGQDELGEIYLVSDGGYIYRLVQK